MGLYTTVNCSLFICFIKEKPNFVSVYKNYKNNDDQFVQKGDWIKVILWNWRSSEAALSSHYPEGVLLYSNSKECDDTGRGFGCWICPHCYNVCLEAFQKLLKWFRFKSGLNAFTLVQIWSWSSTCMKRLGVNRVLGKRIPGKGSVNSSLKWLQLQLTGIRIPSNWTTKKEPELNQKGMPLRLALRRLKS